MTEDEAIRLRILVGPAIKATEQAFAFADKAEEPAPVETLRSALMSLLGVRLACDLLLEREKEAPRARVVDLHKKRG